MAFETRTSYKTDEVCPCCHSVYRKGVTLRPEYRIMSEGMCRNCYKHLYRNSADKHTAGITDDPSNSLIRHRPAQILEKPLFDRKKKFFTGYEYTMPQITEADIITRGVISLVLSALMCAALFICGKFIDSEYLVTCTGVVRIVISALSAYVVLRCPIPLIKGIFCGMGHPRRLLLTAEIILFSVIAVYSFPQGVLGRIAEAAENALA